ncbi:MAG: aldo/keto reductase family protein [Anaerolineae bacterium]|nr:aldo/keto reductase family protein [Anaerolineae bacterium]
MADMEYRRIGTSGLKVSAISIGAWLTYGSDAMAFEASKNCIRAAIESGINFIDCADAYARGGAEKAVGEIVKDYDRQKLVISTKCYWPQSDDVNDRGLSRKHIFESVEKSLRNFDMDYVDIFFCHRYDKETPTDETVRAIEDLIRQGKILYWGTSMWLGSQIEEAVAAADKYNAYRPVVEQPQYNMLDRELVEGDLEQVLDKFAIGAVVWSPLAQGLLTGKYDDGVPPDSRGAAKSNWDNFSDDRIAKAREISQLAREYGYEPSALALAWAMAHPNVDSVITGATKPSHIESNLKALDITLSAELEHKIEKVLKNRPHDSQRSIITPDETAAL